MPESQQAMLRKRTMEIFNDNAKQKILMINEFGKATQSLPKPVIKTRKRLALLPPGVNNAT